MMMKTSTTAPQNRRNVTKAIEGVPPLEYSDGSSSGSEERDEEQGDKSIAKGGVTTPFPWKLHDMLDAMDREGNHSVVCWQPHGRAFMVLKPKEFVDQVMSDYFSQTKYASFQRQLNLYGFSRLSHGRDKGAYYHPCFVRGERNLCRGMVRQKIKGTKVRRSLSPEEEPNFYDPEWNRPKTTVFSPPKVGSSRKATAAPTKVTKKNGTPSIAVPPKSTTLAAPYKAVKVHQHSPSSNQSATSLYSLVMDSNRPAPVGVRAVMPPPPSLVKSLRSSPQSQGTLAQANTMTSAPPQSLPQGSARPGDVLFFEGRPFCYMEHLEELPPLPQRQAQQDQLEQGQSYKDSLSNIISSIVSSEPHRFMDTPNFCSV